MLALNIHQLLLFSLVSLLPFRALASPAPLADIEKRNLPCSKNPIVLILKNTKIAPGATKFCSSFLSIQTKTVNVTPTAYTTPPAVTVTNVNTEFRTVTAADAEKVPNVVATQAITNTNLITATVTRVETSYATITVTRVVQDRPADPNAHRRDSKFNLRDKNPINKRVAIPDYLKAFASQAISSACNCLSIPTPTTTITNPAVTVTTGAAPTETIIQHVTDVFTVKTVTVDVTTTIYTTVDEVNATATVKQTTTVTSAKVVGPTQCAPENIYNSPVNYRGASVLAAAGLVSTTEVQNVESKQECCENCWTAGDCFGFAYGNYDPGEYPIQAPSDHNRCFVYRIVRGCVPEYAAWWIPPGGGPSGGVSGFGRGPCPLALD